MRSFLVLMTFGFGCLGVLWALALIARLFNLSERTQQRLMPVVGILLLASFVYLAKYEGGGYIETDWADRARR